MSQIDDRHSSQAASQLMPNQGGIVSENSQEVLAQNGEILLKKRKRKSAEIPQVIDKTVEQVKKEFISFLNLFKSNSNAETSQNSQLSQSQNSQNTSYYLIQAAEIAQNSTTTMFISMNHLMNFNEDLAIAIIEEYFRFEPALQEAVQEFMRRHFPDHLRMDDREQEKKMFIAFTDISSVKKIRELKTEILGQLISVSGTVTRTSEVRPELLFGGFTCKECMALIKDIKQQFVYTEPSNCTNKKCDNTNNWKLEMTESYFVDWQRARLQENASEIPAGSMPRHIEIILRNEEVEKIKPGDKCVFTGALVVVPDVGQIYGGVEATKTGRKKPDPNYQGVVGLKTLGVRSLSYKLVFLANNASLLHAELAEMRDKEEELDNEREVILEELGEQEKQDILAMSESPNVYQRLAESIAPSIYGHLELKKGILLMLMGGVHKETFDGIKLRGDINVCIVGDPSTAKSQFLKFVCSFLPRSIYTSGKASSAAGLTATVARDPETYEFGIEAGALMLADNGICCIDEFDKMDPKDQAAIHEAMEQQTISITKAGISATLNARASILAAANPIFGRYDLSRTLKDNVSISATIMSRFDLFFVITDICDEGVDYNMARHIVSLHQNKPQEQYAHFSLKMMQNYIRYARTIKPQFDQKALKLAVKQYIELRHSDSGGTKSAYRITVRQLESIIRLSEALARVELKDIITENHVREAGRLLKKSIIPLHNEDVNLNYEIGEMSLNESAESSKNEKSITLPFEEYKKISSLFIHYIRQNEKRSDQNWKGIKQQKVLEWYLEQGNELGLFSGEDEAAKALNLANHVINRLIKIDNILVVVDEPDFISEENQNDRLIDVHPNFDPETNEVSVSQRSEIGNFSQNSQKRKNKIRKKEKIGINENGEKSENNDENDENNDENDEKNEFDPKEIDLMSDENDNND